MQDRHHNRKKYFEEQAYTTARHVLPHIREHHSLVPGARILEIGCGEGGNLKPFLDEGFEVYGIDLAVNKIKNAQTFFHEHPRRDHLHAEATDVFDYRPGVSFDLVFLRDVLEHIHRQKDFMQHLGALVSSGGVVFLGFPPWRNPFGGHQQICRSKLSKAPYIHLLPPPWYRRLLNVAGESKGTVSALMEIRDTRISIRRFEKILRQGSFSILHRQFWFINPNYEIKMNLRPRRLLWPFSSIPLLRDFLTTTCYYLIKKT